MALPQFDFLQLLLLLRNRSLNGAASALGLPFSLPPPSTLFHLASLSLSSPVFCVKTPSNSATTIMCMQNPVFAFATVTRCLHHHSQSSSIQSQHIAQYCFETLDLFLQHDAPPQKHPLDFLLSTSLRFSHPTILVSCRIPVAARRFCLCSPLVLSCELRTSQRWSLRSVIALVASLAFVS